MANLRPALLAIPMIVAGAVALRADPIPQTVLDDNQKSCAQSCAASGKPQDKCVAYCTCSTDAIEEKFTADEYFAMNKAAVPGKSVLEQPIDQGSKDKLVAVIKSCGPKLQ